MVLSIIGVIVSPMVYFHLRTDDGANLKDYLIPLSYHNLYSCVYNTGYIYIYTYILLSNILYSMCLICNLYILIIIDGIS